MEYPRPHVLLAVEPGVLQGALARMLSAAFGHQIVQMGREEAEAFGGALEAAVVSDELPQGVRAKVVITLPDTRGSGGIGTVRTGDDVEHVSISGADRVVELLAEYIPGRNTGPEHEPVDSE